MTQADEYSIDELASDLRGLCARCSEEREILLRLRPLVRRAALAKRWLHEGLYVADAAQGFGVHLLREEADHTLAIFAVSWLPGRGAPPHDHGTWAMIAGVDGAEANEFYERIDDRSRSGHAELRKVGRTVCDVGDVIAMPAGMIHAVSNESDATSVSLHVYGKHINHTGRSRFDLERQTASPFIVTTDR
jgi:predicted metal-dependent enzyme (double-stranded beta helix superfamily)